MRAINIYHKFSELYAQCFYINKTEKTIKVENSNLIGTKYLPFTFEGYKVIYTNRRI